MSPLSGVVPQMAYTWLLHIGRILTIRILGGVFQPTCLPEESLSSTKRAVPSVMSAEQWLAVHLEDLTAAAAKNVFTKTPIATFEIQKLTPWHSPCIGSQIQTTRTGYVEIDPFTMYHTTHSSYQCIGLFCMVERKYLSQTCPLHAIRFNGGGDSSQDSLSSSNRAFLVGVLIVPCWVPVNGLGLYTKALGFNSCIVIIFMLVPRVAFSICIICLCKCAVIWALVTRSWAVKCAGLFEHSLLILWKIWTHINIKPYRQVPFHCSHCSWSLFATHYHTLQNMFDKTFLIESMIRHPKRTYWRRSSLLSDMWTALHKHFDHHSKSLRVGTPFEGLLHGSGRTGKCHPPARSCPVGCSVCTHVFWCPTAPSRRWAQTCGYHPPHTHHSNGLDFCSGHWFDDLTCFNPNSDHLWTNNMQKHVYSRGPKPWHIPHKPWNLAKEVGNHLSSACRLASQARQFPSACRWNSTKPSPVFLIFHQMSAMVRVNSNPTPFQRACMPSLEVITHDRITMEYVQVNQEQTTSPDSERCTSRAHTLLTLKEIYHRQTFGTPN